MHLPLAPDTQHLQQDQAWYLFETDRMREGGGDGGKKKKKIITNKNQAIWFTISNGVDAMELGFEEVEART